jgi:hypothetical protein
MFACCSDPFDVLFFAALKVYREVKDVLKEKQLEAEDDHSDCSGWTSQDAALNG